MGHRPWFSRRIGVEKKDRLVSPLSDALVIGSAKSKVCGVGDEFAVGELRADEIGGTIVAVVVHNDHLVYVVKRLQASAKEVFGVVAHNNGRDRNHAKVVPQDARMNSMSGEILLTKEGYEKLAAELAELKGPRRQAIADAIREAKAHGDLRENAAYHEAKLNQSRNEGRIQDLDKVLLMAQVVERPEHAGEMAHLGSQVTLFDLQFEEELEITLVGSFEADPANDMVSISSPLGSAVLGKVIGDELEVEAPRGTQKYKILGISG